MAAIRAAILYLHCMLFPLTMYPIVHTCTKFEQNRTGGSKVMSYLIFSKKQYGCHPGGHFGFTVYVISRHFVSHSAKVF